MTVHVSWAMLVVLALLGLAAMQAALAVIQARFVRSVDRLLDGMCNTETQATRGEADPSSP